MERALVDLGTNYSSGPGKDVSSSRLRAMQAAKHLKEFQVDTIWLLSKPFWDPISVGR